MMLLADDTIHIATIITGGIIIIISPIVILLEETSGNHSLNAPLLNEKHL